ncbi:hypothetical protein SDC9_107108 [bioreactor metagenome]|uniref:Uncharacterized protein n=1 Tax=bioreactor metagenome TaxID=1076179 RepID=A0A645B4C4_9ZZZZ|nr:hypothetical protein [Oscillibacter sp.]
MFKFTQSMKYSTMRDVGVASFGVALVSAVLLFSGIFSGIATGVLTVLLLASGGLTTCMLDSYILRLKASQEAASAQAAEISTPSAAEKTAA